MKKHIHAELIKKWADGADIQVWDANLNVWKYQQYPAFYDDYEYREKPKPKIACAYSVIGDEMKPFDLEAAKRGEPIFYALNPSYPITFIGVRRYGSIVYEGTDGQLECIHEYWLRMAEPPRPEWQQKLIDAAKAGKVVEFGKYTWIESDLNTKLDDYDFRRHTQDNYRIRPEKVTRYLWAELDINNEWHQDRRFMTKDEASEHFHCAKECKRLDWSATVFEE